MSTNSIVIAVDTETTGIPNRSIPYTNSSKNKIRLVSMGWQSFKPIINADKNVIEYKLQKTQYYIVKPNGFNIPLEVEKIHHISTNKATRDGVDIMYVLNQLYNDITEYVKQDIPVLAVAHNMKFDKHIILSEVYRSGFKELEQVLNSLPTYCTMYSSKNILKIPSKYYSGYKLPRLKELFNYYFNNESYQEHNALEDVKVCARCYFKLKGIVLI